MAAATGIMVGMPGGTAAAGRMTAGTTGGAMTITGIIRCVFWTTRTIFQSKSEINLKHHSYEPRAGRLAIAGVFLLSGIGLASVPTQSWSAPASGQSETAPATAGVNGLIAHLHQELKITPAQESLFQKLADVMRENTERMSTMAKQRADAATTATAVDDLKSYAEISEAHAKDTQKMIMAFQPLYDSMSDDQKKTADQEFREHYATHHHGRP